MWRRPRIEKPLVLLNEGQSLLTVKGVTEPAVSVSPLFPFQTYDRRISGLTGCKFFTGLQYQSIIPSATILLDLYRYHPFCIDMDYHDQLL